MTKIAPSSSQECRRCAAALGSEKEIGRVLQKVKIEDYGLMGCTSIRYITGRDGALRAHRERVNTNNVHIRNINHDSRRVT